MTRKRHKTERKYALTRIRSGSYLLPSNDAKTLWHIYRFEDGESHGLTGEPDRMWWACARFLGTFEQAQLSVMNDLMEYDYIGWDNWREYGSYMKTRAEAIECALEAS